MSEKKELEIRELMVEVCQRLHRRNLLAAADGNISYRISDERILITPSGVNKAFLSMDDICVINMKGETILGMPSGESRMHLAVYRYCEKAKAVVHAHPPTAIAWSVARPEMKELPSRCLSEVILACGSIPVAPYARPGSESMGDVLVPFLPKHRVMILARHGGLSWGESLEEAYNGMERLEHSAEILWRAHQLGALTELPEEEVRFLRSLRSQIGEKTL